jgi:leader peptidase (prepilin peptidase)/N-methyltransferase
MASPSDPQSIVAPLTTGQAALLAALWGIVAGNRLAKWTPRFVAGVPWTDPITCDACDARPPFLHRLPLVGSLAARFRCPACGTRYAPATLTMELLCAALCATFATAVAEFDALGTTETHLLRTRETLRMVGLLVPVVLLAAAAVSDLRWFVVPDGLTVPGMLLAVLYPLLAGSVELTPLWSDWTGLDPQAPDYGTLIPAWIGRWPRLHGAAVALAGAGVGFVGGLVLRGVAGFLAGREAFGFGDVMLMGMIGAWLGWQAAVVSFALAPLIGLATYLPIRLLGRTSHVPYGPSLCLAAFAVLCRWRATWNFEWHDGAVRMFALRWTFSDPPVLAIVGAGAAAGTVLLLGAWRLAWLVPLRRRSRTLVPDERPVESGATEEDDVAQTAGGSDAVPARDDRVAP